MYFSPLITVSTFGYSIPGPERTFTTLPVTVRIVSVSDVVVVIFVVEDDTVADVEVEVDVEVVSVDVEVVSVAETVVAVTDDVADVCETTDELLLADDADVLELADDAVLVDDAEEADDGTVDAVVPPSDFLSHTV